MNAIESFELLKILNYLKSSIISSKHTLEVMLTRVLRFFVPWPNL